MVGVLGAQTYHHLKGFPLIVGHDIGSPDALRGIIVEGVAHVAIRAGRHQQFIQILPVGAEHLVLVRTRGTVEGIFVEERGASFVAVHTAGLQREIIVEGIRQVCVGRLVLIVVVLPAARGGLVGLQVCALEENLGVVGRLVEGSGDHTSPVEGQRAVQEGVLALQGAVEDMLLIVLEADG